MDGLVGEECMELPPGFRFHPTDVEVISHYLMEKIMDNNFNPAPIGEVDLNECEPWDLPGKAKMGEKEYYFFCKKGKKYPTGTRTNRATKAGYWKATGKDKKIQRGKNCLVGMKKTLVFYTGRAPQGAKTNWVMHEFRLEGPSTDHFLPKDEWVVCKVFYKGLPSDQTKPKPQPQVAPNVVDQHAYALQNLGVSTAPFYGGNDHYMGTYSTNIPMENQQYPHQFPPPQFVPTPGRFPNPTHLHQSGDTGLMDPNPMWQFKEEQYPEQPIVCSPPVDVGGFNPTHGARSIMTRNQFLEDFQYLLASPPYPTFDDNNFFC